MNHSKDKEVKNIWVNRMLIIIPEIKTLEPFSIKLQELIDEDLGGNFIFELVFLPYFLMILGQTKHESKQNISKIIELIEEMANNEDYWACEMARYFVDRLANHFESIDKLDFLMPKSLELAEERLQDWEWDKKTIGKIYERIPEFNNLDEKLKTTLDRSIKNKEGSYIVYADVLKPYFIDLIKNPTPENEKIALKISSLIEELLNSGDRREKELGDFGFIESIVGDVDFQLLEKYFFPKTLKIAKTY
jgi:hypothetical protein